MCGPQLANDLLGGNPFTLGDLLTSAFFDAAGAVPKFSPAWCAGPALAPTPSARRDFPRAEAR